MQKIIIEKPYRFVPPHRGRWLPTFIRKFELFRTYLRRTEGVVDYECRGTELLRESLAAGHGILLTPNHCRTADPIVMGWLAKETDCLVYAMASWHLFNHGWFNAWAIRAMGGFSVNREGVDRQAISTAIDDLVSAERPLVIFPEGTTSRTNDRLQAMLDGVAFIARTAAKRRAKLEPPGKVVVHPVGLKYLFRGDLKATVEPVLTSIEERLSWQPQRQLPLRQRIEKVGYALLAVKEVEYFGAPQSGSPAERLTHLIERILVPLEDEWFGRPQSDSIAARVKPLRMKITPEITAGTLDERERARRWRQLADVYLAQQLACYPAGYLAERPSVDRLLETVERFQDDLTDQAIVPGHLKVVIQVGPAIEVSPERDRKAPVDPLMQQIESALAQMLEKLAEESPLYEED